MRKTLAGILLAAALTMGVTTTAFASEATPQGTETAKLEWSYITSNDGTPSAYPMEKVDFLVTAASDNPSFSHIKADDLYVEGNPDYIEIPIPGYTVPGVYNYTIKITVSNVQGISRDASEYTIGMQVLAAYDDDRNIVTTVGFTSADNGKLDKFVSKYDLGTLTVESEVNGNLGSYEDEFTINVTLKADGAGRVKNAITYVDGGVEKAIQVDDFVSAVSVTVPLTLKHGESVTFSNIPANMTYVVEQVEAEGYSTSISYVDDEKKISADDADKVTVTNTKNASIDTGVFLDNMPIVMAAAVAAAGVVALLALKRRKANR